VFERLPLPYEAHPAFRTLEAEADIAAIAAFNDAYSRLERGDATAGPDALAALHRVLSRPSTSDLHFTDFIAELLVLAEQRLRDDIGHFIKQGTPVGEHGDERTRQFVDERYFITALSAGAVTDLQDIVRGSLRDLRTNAAAGKVRREDLSINQGAIPQRIIEVLYRDFERSAVHEAVSAYARRRMRVSGVALELSVPSATWWRNQYSGFGRPPHTLYAHTDEGIANLKAIAYLTDVTAENGPMSVYPKCEEKLQLTALQKLVGRVINSVGASESSPLFELYGLAADPRPFVSPAFRNHFGQLATALRYNSHVGWDVLPNSALEELLVTSEKRMLGPAGTIAVFDGARLFHRGGMVERGERVALQIVFAPQSHLMTAAARTVGAGRDMFSRYGDLVDGARKLRRRVGRTVQRFSFEPHERLLRKLARQLPELTCVDIGASYYAHPTWELFQRAPRTRWIAVEPNEQNTAYLDAWPWPSQPIRVPHGLSEHGGEQILHVTATDSGSSLLPPVINEDMAHRVRDRDYFFPVVQRTIATKSLDEIIPSGSDPVFVKLDTQGSELSILRGAARLFASGRLIGIETEATLLANPVMVGSGRFWEVCQFLEARGFELLQMKPIEGGPPRPHHRTYLNECDAAFCLRRSELVKRSAAARLAAVGFYVSYRLYDEARSLIETVPDLEGAYALRKLLDS
jgi:FkbM family methyltransferase